MQGCFSAWHRSARALWYVPAFKAFRAYLFDQVDELDIELLDPVTTLHAQSLARFFRLVQFPAAALGDRGAVDLDNAIADATAMVTSEKVRDAKSVVDRAFDNATKSATTLAKAAGENFDKTFGEAKTARAATSPGSEAKPPTEAGKAEAGKAGETAEETAEK